MKRTSLTAAALVGMIIMCFPSNSLALSDAYHNNIFLLTNLKPFDSIQKIKEGEHAPDFSLRSVAGEIISLKQFKGSKNVVISFIPAAWTPICSDQWPGYNIVKDIFDANNATLIGVSVDNIPTLYAWTKQMGELWFHVCSDFYPHGKVAESYGVLRSEGTAERAIFIIDKQGIVRFAKRYDINTRPPLEDIVKGLESTR